MANKKQWRFYSIVFIVIVLATVAVLASGSLDKLNSPNADLSFLVEDEIIYITNEDSTRVLLLDSELIDLLEPDLWQEKFFTPSLKNEESIEITIQDEDFSIKLYIDSSNAVLNKDGFEIVYKVPKSIGINLEQFILEYDQLHLIDEELWNSLSSEKWLTSEHPLIMALDFYENDGIKICQLSCFDYRYDPVKILTFDSQVVFTKENEVLVKLPNVFTWEKLFEGEAVHGDYFLKVGDNVIFTRGYRFNRDGYDYLGEDIMIYKHSKALIKVWDNIREVVINNIDDKSDEEELLQQYLVTHFDEKIIMTEVLIADREDLKENESLVFFAADVFTLMEYRIGFNSVTNAFIVTYTDSTKGEIANIELKMSFADNPYEQKIYLFGEGFDTVFDEYGDELKEMKSIIEVRRASIMELISTNSSYIRDVKIVERLKSSDYADKKTIDGAVRDFYLDKLDYDYEGFRTLTLISWYECHLEQTTNTATLYCYSYSQSHNAMSSGMKILHLRKYSDEWQVEYEDSESVYRDELMILFGEYKDVLFMFREDEF